jgi:hypothetical protein
VFETARREDNNQECKQEQFCFHLFEPFLRLFYQHRLAPKMTSAWPSP